MLSGLTSAHTIKWANALNACGIKVFVAGLIDYDRSQFNDGIDTYCFNISKNISFKNYGSYSKLIYLKVIPKLKRIIKSYNPDLLHSHLASSYGLLGALLNFHPYIVSVWGFDVYSFPQKSFLHRNILKWIFKKADLVLSTSKTMAKETSKYANKKILVTPFGIDINTFYPFKHNNNDEIVIGTVKNLEKWYGIEYLIKAFKIVYNKFPDKKLKLLIVGNGTMANYFKELVRNLEIENVTEFTGFIPYKNVSSFHNKLDIYVAVSTYNDESFGVSILEASACGKPVIVSSIGGLTEVVDNYRTGIIVPPNDEFSTAKAIEKLILDKLLREKLGCAGREYVLENYNLKNNVADMIKIYNSLLKN